MSGQPINPQTVVVTELGMVSSLGPDVVSSCAAARAGITRAGPLEGPQVFDEESGELVPIAGHCVVGTGGFSGVGRMVVLGQKAIRDLLSRSGPGVAELGPLPIYCSVPGGYYQRERDQRELLPHADSLPFDLDAVIRFENQRRQSEMSANLVPRLSAASPAPFAEAISRLYFGEQSAMVDALNDAVSQLQSGNIGACVVGGVDSMVDPQTLLALFDLGILKTPVQSTGLLPGEAAAFGLLETCASARRRGAPVLAVIENPVQRQEDVHRFSDAPPGGRALAQAICETVGAPFRNRSCPGLVIGNLNGDTWRARDWGTALVRLPAEVRDATNWTLADPFGDVGAASGAVALCMGVRAFQRGYASSGSIVVGLSGDDGRKGTFLLHNLQN